jgi:hypothetical protein
MGCAIRAGPVLTAVLLASLPASPPPKVGLAPRHVATVPTRFF